MRELIHVSVVLIICCLLTPSDLLAQERGSTNRTNPPTTGSNPFGNNPFAIDQDSTSLLNDSLPEVVIDTSDAIRLNAFSPFLESYINDTLIGPEFNIFDPGRKNKYHFVHAGNVGTQVYPLVFNRSFNPNGRSWSDDVFRFYIQDQDSFKIYRLSQAITRTSFYMKPGTENGQFSAELSRTFAKDINLSFSFQKNNQEANFLHSGALSEYLNLGISRSNINKLYQAIYYYHFSRNEVSHNNGLVNIADEITANVSLLNVQSTTANTNIRRSKHLYRHSLNIGKAESAYKFSVLHQLSLYQDQVRFSDSEVSSSYSSAFYQNFNPLGFTEGLRLFSRTRILENKGGIYLLKHKEYKDDEPNERIFYLEAGLQYQNILHEMEPVQSRLNSLALYGDLDWTLFEGLQVMTKAQLGFGNTAGTYALHPSASYKWKDNIELNAGIDIHAQLPGFHQQVLLINQQEIWANSLQTSRSQRIYAKAEWKKGLPIHAGISQMSLQNHIYMDQNQNLQQFTENINIQQLNLGAKLKLWRIHLDNDVYLQNISEDIIRRPKLIGMSSLYYKGFLFKGNMWARFGADLRTTDPYRIDAFQPAANMFYLQDDYTSPWQFNMDAFFAFKIQSFRFTFRVKDVLAATRNQFLFYQYGYAQEPLDFRLGIAWDFVD